MNFIAIIPARFASTRFPGKPLAKINGKPMIQHVYERCQSLLQHVYVATDDERIAQAVTSFGGKYLMTSSNHPSGTDRVAEAADQLSKTIDFDVVLNIQGDEPFVASDQISQLMACFDDSAIDIATLITPIVSTTILTDQNKVKAIIAQNNKALYFSRSAIPFVRDIPQEEWLKSHHHFLHLGLYAYRKDVLKTITQLKPSPLEMLEKLEQLRWLEYGFTIKAAITEHENFGVDTPQDLEKLLQQIK